MNVNGLITAREQPVIILLILIWGFFNNWGDIMERIYGEGFSYQSI